MQVPCDPNRVDFHTGCAWRRTSARGEAEPRLVRRNLHAQCARAVARFHGRSRRSPWPGVRKGDARLPRHASRHVARGTPRHVAARCTRSRAASRARDAARERAAARAKFRAEGTAGVSRRYSIPIVPVRVATYGGFLAGACLHHRRHMPVPQERAKPDGPRCPAGTGRPADHADRGGPARRGPARHGSIVVRSRGPAIGPGGPSPGAADPASRRRAPDRGPDTSQGAHERARPAPRRPTRGNPKRPAAGTPRQPTQRTPRRPTRHTPQRPTRPACRGRNGCAAPPRI